MKKKPAFRIAVAYENFAAGIRARDLSEGLAAELEPDVEIESSYWEFPLLDGRLRKQASNAAADADMVIIAVASGAELPARVRDWIENSLIQKRNNPSALVALLDQKMPGEPPPACAYLQDMAAKAGMDFFCKTGGWPQQGLETSIVAAHRQRQGSGPGMQHAFQYALHANPGFHGWGINE